MAALSFFLFDFFKSSSSVGARTSSSLSAHQGLSAMLAVTQSSRREPRIKSRTTSQFESRASIFWTSLESNTTPRPTTWLKSTATDRDCSSVFVPSCDDPRPGCDTIILEFHEVLDSSVALVASVHELCNLVDDASSVGRMSSMWSPSGTSRRSTLPPPWLATMMSLCSVGGSCAPISSAAEPSLRTTSRLLHPWLYLAPPDRNSDHTLSKHL